MFPCHMTLVQEAAAAPATEPTWIAENSNTGFGTSLSLAKPTGTTYGDIMVMAAGIYVDSGVGNNSVGAATAGDTNYPWIEIDSATTLTNATVRMWYRYVGETETLSNNESVAFSNSTSKNNWVAIQTWRDAGPITFLADNTGTSTSALASWTEPTATDGTTIAGLCSGNSAFSLSYSTSLGTPAPEQEILTSSLFNVCGAIVARGNDNRAAETMGKTCSFSSNFAAKAALIPFGGDGVSAVGTDGPDESSAGTDITLTIPGSPQPGDVMIVNQSGDSIATLGAMGTGWIEIGSQMTTGGLDMRTWWKPFEEGDTTVVVPFSGGGAKYNMASMVVLRGVTIPRITGETGLGDTTNTTVTAHDNGTAFNEADSAGYTVICGAVGDTGAATSLTTDIGTGWTSISANHTSEGSNFIMYRLNTGATSQTAGKNSSASADSLIRVISCSAINTSA